jgi:hypothetical protein
MKGWTRLRGLPLSLAGADRDRLASLKKADVTVKMKSSSGFRAIRGFPKYDLRWGRWSSGSLVLTLAKVNSAKAELAAEFLGSVVFQFWGAGSCDNEVRGAVKVWVRGGNAGTIHTIPVLGVDSKIIRVSQYSVQLLLVLGVSAQGIRSTGGNGVGAGVDETELVVSNGNFQESGAPRVTIVFAICIDKDRDRVNFC